MLVPTGVLAGRRKGELGCAQGFAAAVDYSERYTPRVRKKESEKPDGRDQRDAVRWTMIVKGLVTDNVYKYWLEEQAGQLTRL